MKEYRPTEQDIKLLTLIEDTKLQVLELSWLNAAIVKEMEHHCKAMLFAFEMDDTAKVRWNRKQLAKYSWLSDRITVLYRNEANSKIRKKNPILRMPVVVLNKKSRQGKSITKAALKAQKGEHRIHFSETEQKELSPHTSEN